MNLLKNSLSIILIMALLTACSTPPSPTLPPPTTIDNILYQGHFLKSYNNLYLTQLIRKIKERQGLKIRILGDSHTAGDFFSDELRSLLFEQADSPGFLYPIQPRYHQSLVASYQHKHFKVLNSLKNAKEDYPLGGVIATATRKQAYIKLNLKTRYTRNLKSTIVFRSPSQKAAFKLTDAQGKTYTLKAPTAGKWSFFTRELSYPIRITALQKNASLGGYFITRSPHDNIIDTLGINGANSGLWKKWNLNLVRRELFEIRYDLVIIAYGTNDIIAALPTEKILDNLKELIALIKESSPSTAIMLLTPPTVIKESKRRLRRIPDNFDTIQQALIKLAQQEQLLLFNTHAFMEDSGGKEIWIIKNLSKKDTHLTPLGYRFIARKILQELYTFVKQ